MLGCQRLRERRLEVATGLLSDPERRREHVGQLGLVGHARQLDEPGAVGEAVDDLGRHLQDQPGLARSPAPGEGHQPAVTGDVASGLSQLALASHEAGDLLRQVARHCVEAQARELALEPRVDDLGQHHRLVEVLQAVAAQLDE